MPVCVYVWHLIRSMSFNNAHVGDSAGVSAPVSFDSMLAKLGEVHRGGLNQAQVLSKVAELAQASANGAPGKSFDFVQLRMVDWSTYASKAYSYAIPGVQ